MYRYTGVQCRGKPKCVEGEAEKPWTWRSQMCKAHGIVMLPRWSRFENLLSNGWKCHEQMQEVSLVSPLLVSIADIGDKLLKIVADLLCSFSLEKFD